MILILKCLLYNYVENNLNKPLLSFSISVLILICTKIRLFAFWVTLKHLFFYSFPQYLKQYFLFETFSVTR